MDQTPSIIPSAGERALIVGQTGSGKTALGAWILIRTPTAPCILYDTKEEAKFPKLPNSVIVETMEQCAKEYDNPEIDYIIVRPPLEILDEPKELDLYLLYHYHHFRHSTAYIDEAYSFHHNSRPGKGLVALFTRGRSRGITTIISTQRPRHISLFLMSEAQKVFVMALGLKDDRKRMGDVIPGFEDLPLPPKHGFYFFESGNNAAELFKPIKLDPVLNTGYTDEQPVEESHNIIKPDNPATKHVWI